MFKFAGPKLGKLGSRHQRQDDICGKSFFYRGFNAECVRRVDEDACVLGRDDGIDDGGKVVYIWEGLYAQNDVIEGAIADARSVFGIADD